MLIYIYLAKLQASIGLTKFHADIDLAIVNAHTDNDNS